MVGTKSTLRDPVQYSVVSRRRHIDKAQASTASYSCVMTVVRQETLPFKYSIFKKNNFIFGSTDQTDFLSKNYINIKISNSSSKLTSTTNEYCKELVKKIKNKNFDLIEIHNRPLVFNILKKKLDAKFIIYFHNDPLSMKGSKTVKERLNIISNVEKSFKTKLRN